MEVSIYELLAAARESAKSDYIKGDSILCEKRFHPDTHYMVDAYSVRTAHPFRRNGAPFRFKLSKAQQVD